MVLWMSMLIVVTILCSNGLSISVSADQHDIQSSFTRNRSIRQSTNFSEYIWDNAVDLLAEAWETTFISGVRNGNLDPYFYGDYVLQDAIYCRIVAQLWTQLANNASVEEEIREYANGSIRGFQVCSVDLFDMFNVKDDRGNSYGVLVKQPVQDYTSFINATMTENAHNTLIATYACLKLWNNLTNELWKIVEANTSNPYRIWVEDNFGSGSSARRQADQMDKWDQDGKLYDWSEGLSLFRCAMKNEINFFNHAGNSSAVLNCEEDISSSIT
ncbi:hypothetical protein KP509_26G010800 [Ceratopteris richardii]|uniref:Uncharacterized protein n=1 Tax=Ceratopteris richardii TaxID=49495 RepID=A0A8T2RIB0_CERRI|nr:hypothetical protein KP509_26G010800 [Ceratopteris richardii]